MLAPLSELFVLIVIYHNLQSHLTQYLYVIVFFPAVTTLETSEVWSVTDSLHGKWKSC